MTTESMFSFKTVLLQGSILQCFQRQIYQATQ